MKEEEEELIKILQEETFKRNSVAQIASKNNRDYVTSEDVSESLKQDDSKEWKDKVRLDVLEIMCDNTGFGMEARDLCALSAFEGK